MDKKKIYLLIAIFTIILTFFGGTLAYLRWETSVNQRTNVVLTIDKDFMCEVDGGGNINKNEKKLVPTSCMNSDYVIKRRISVNPTVYNEELGVTLNLWLDINDIGSGFSGSQNLRYALTRTGSSCSDGVVASGNFNGKIAGDKIELLNLKFYPETKTDIYYLYIWLDSAEKNPATMNQEIDISFNGNCSNISKPKTYISYSEEDTTLRIHRKLETTETDNLVEFDLENSVYTEEQLPWYSYRENITRVIVEDQIFPVYMDYWFKGMKNLTYLDISKINTSQLITLIRTFSGLESLTSLDLSHFDTFYVISMNFAFTDSTGLTSLDLSNLNTSKLVGVAGMFDGMTNLTSLDISNWNTSNVTMMHQMFRNTALTSLDLSHFDTSKVTTMSLMFAEMTNLTTLDLSNWNTSKVTSMNYMFQNCEKLASLDLSHFDTSKVTNMHGMFNRAYSLNSLNISGFDTTYVTDMSYMFQRTPLSNLDVSSFNTSNATNMSYMFSEMNNLESLDLSSFNTSKVTSMASMFKNMEKLTNLDFRNANFSTVTSYSDMFLNVPANSNIIVKDTTQKSWINNKFTNLTNVNIAS